jgi:hypothetical protein
MRVVWSSAGVTMGDALMALGWSVTIHSVGAVPVWV